MKNYIISESNFKFLIENLQTTTTTATITGKLGENDKYYYVNNPKIADGGTDKLPLNDLSRLIEDKGILHIEVGDKKFEIDLNTCSNVKILSNGNLQIPKKCYNPKESDVPVNDKKIINPPISKGDLYKLEKRDNVFYYTTTELTNDKKLRFFNDIYNFKSRFDNLPDGSTIIFKDMYNKSNIEYEYNKNEVRISNTNGNPYVSASDDISIKITNENFYEKLNKFVSDDESKKFFLYGKEEGFNGMFSIIQSKISNLSGYKELTNQKILESIYNGIKLLDEGRHRVMGNGIFKENENTYRIEKYDTINKELNNFILKNEYGNYKINFKSYYDEDNEWHYINKLNTNYSDIIDLLDKLKGNLKFGDYKSIKEFLKENQSNIIESINNIREKDFLEFTKNTEKNTEKGNKTEKKVIKNIDKGGWTELWRAENGNILDMFFGFDIIGKTPNNKISTLQVKTNLGDLRKLKLQYKYVDYFADSKKIILRYRDN
jgi:hypothetical protein